MANLAEEISTDIQSALEADQLDLPSLPEVALEIREVAESETVTAAKLSSVVSKDPGLATQLVRIANSPLFRATRSIDDLAHAVSRLGVEYSANLVTGLAMQQMFQATSDMVDNKLRQVWKHSSDVAAWSSILASRYTKLRPDQATLAGLTHSIGVLPILGWVEENDHVVRDSMTLDKVVDAIHPTIGTMILKSWNFADEITAVPEHYQMMHRTGGQSSYTDLVCAANLISLRETDHPLVQEDWRSAATLVRIGLGPDLDDALIVELEEDVDSVRNVFA